MTIHGGLRPFLPTNNYEQTRRGTAVLNTINMKVYVVSEERGDVIAVYTTEKAARKRQEELVQYFDTNSFNVESFDLED